MKLPRKKLAEIFLEFINQSPKLNEAVVKIAAYLVETRRAGELRAILREMEALRSQTIGVVEINAISAFKLEHDIKEQVAKLFDVKRAIFHEAVDESVLGGARFETLNKKVDLTLKHKLDQLKATTLGDLS